MAIFPFTEDVDDLIGGMDLIPIDDSVPFAEGFKKLLIETGGNPWGPQITARSKLATRLHFAGWTSRQLEKTGLKPKDVANFRQRNGLVHKTGRPVSTKGHPPTAALSTPNPLEAIHLKMQALEAEIEMLQHRLAADEKRIEECRDELAKWGKTLEVAPS